MNPAMSDAAGRGEACIKEGNEEWCTSPKVEVVVFLARVRVRGESPVVYVASPPPSEVREL